MADTQIAFAKRLYDNRSSYYDDSWHPSFAQKFTELANLQPGEHVLDLACGTGLVTFDAAKRVGPSGNVIGVDVSEGMLAVAKRKQDQLGHEAKNVKLLLHDIAHLDEIDEFKDKTFDIITCASALVLLGEAERVLEEWKQYLKPGGRLILDVPHERNLMAGKLLDLVSKPLGIQVPYDRSWVKNQESLKEILRTTGLEVELEEFVEQAGYGKRYYTAEDAEDQFVSQLMAESGRIFRTPRERREKAMELFKAEWEKWSVDGKVEEVDGVYVAVARKPAS